LRKIEDIKAKDRREKSCPTVKRYNAIGPEELEIWHQARNQELLQSKNAEASKNPPNPSLSFESCSQIVIRDGCYHRKSK